MSQSQDLTHSYAHINGVRLHLVEAGPADGPLVVLLHGFPEYWAGWSAQIAFLAEKGYRVVAPDQRGYNLSEKPKGAANYAVDVLADDVLALIDHYNRPKAIVAGHDWGACVAWWLGSRNPERLDKLVIVNVPHPIVMKKRLRESFSQLRKSWYMFFFQLPLLPEAVISASRFAVAARSLVGSSRPGTFSADELEQYREAWGRPGAITGMLNWYRALFRAQPSRLPNVRVKVPTLIVWGNRDKFLGTELAALSKEICDDARLEIIDGASHWVLHEEPARVNALLDEFFA